MPAEEKATTGRVCLLCGADDGHDGPYECPEVDVDADARRHRTVRTTVGRLPMVAGVDTLEDSDSPTGRTTEIYLSDVDTVPPAVLQRIAAAGLGIDDVMERPESMWVSVR